MNACTHGMPTPASCVECMEDGNLPPAPRPEPERVVARCLSGFGGQCPACDLPIAVGARIAKTNRDRWLHDGCAP